MVCVVCGSRRGKKMGRRNYAWLAHRMHARNLELHKTNGKLQRDWELQQRNFDSLYKEYMLVLKERNDLKIKHHYTMWALQELTNGMGGPAIQLYEACELQLRIPYYKRDRIGDMVAAAANAMKAANGGEFRRDTEADAAILEVSQI